VPLTIEGMPRRREQTSTEEANEGRRKSAPVRIDADLAEMLAHISLRRKKNVSDILSPHIRAWVEGMYKEVLDEMQKLKKN
jgi:hypothetical protein